MFEAMLRWRRTQHVEELYTRFDFAERPEFLRAYPQGRSPKRTDPMCRRAEPLVPRRLTPEQEVHSCQIRRPPLCASGMAGADDVPRAPNPASHPALRPARPVHAKKEAKRITLSLGAGYHGLDKEGRPIYIQMVGAVDVRALAKITRPERVVYSHIQAGGGKPWTQEPTLPALSLCLLQLLTPGPLAAALDPRHKCRAPFPRSTQGYEYLMREILPACSKLAGRRVDKGFGIMDAKGLGLGTLTGEVRHVMRATTQLTQVGNPSDPDRTNSAFWGAGSASVCVLWLAGHGGLVGAASVPAGQLSRDQRSARHHQRTVHLQGERSSGHDLSRGTFSRLGVHWPYRASVDRRGAVEQRRRVDGARPESRFPACSLAICSIGEAQSAPSWRASVAYPPFGGHRGEACESPTLHWSPLPAAAACRPSLPSCDPC